MTKGVEYKLSKIPLINILVRVFKQIKLPGFGGFSFYDLLELYIRGIVRGALTSRAGAIAFSFFMALFPFLLFVLIVIPYVPIDNFKVDFLQFLESFLPPSTSDFFFENIFEGIDNSERSGLVSSVFILSIILMANGVNGVFSAFEFSYHKNSSLSHSDQPNTFKNNNTDKKPRSVFKQYLVALCVALILGFLLIVTIAILGYFQIYVVNGVQRALETSGFKVNERNVIWTSLPQYVFSVLMIYLATATLYFFGTEPKSQPKFFSIGAFFTTVLIVLTSYLFGVYIENFAQYNKLYGSIGGLLILMFYLWLNSNILLLGQELNTAIQSLKKQF